MATGLLRESATAGRRAAPRAQLWRFGLVGVLCAAVDYAGYRGLLALGVASALAKGASYVAATVVAYVGNRRWTFRAGGGPARASGFALLYGLGFGLNVGVNALGLHLLPAGVPYRVVVAWVVAGAAGSVVNFVALRTLVFRPDRGLPSMTWWRSGR